jgi:hypothetical protein
VPAVAVGANDEVVELLRLPIGRAGEFTVGSVWLGEPGGAADERTVRIELHRGDAEMVVPEGRGDADRLEVVEMVREWHQSDTQSKNAAGGGFAIEPHLAASDLWVADCGETSGQVNATGVGQQRHRILAR